MMKICFFLIFLSSLIYGNEFSDFDKYQGKISRKQLEEQLQIYLQRDPGIQNFYEITDDCFTLYQSAEGKERCVEYALKLATPGLESLIENKKKESLAGVKIALDPGHFGAQIARLEERYIDMPQDVAECGGAQFDEGTLSFLTAMHLKELLEKEGAIVYLTRESIGKGAYPEDFFDWLRRNPQHFGSSLSLSKIFRDFYNPLDLRARAKKINAFQPDLTLIIHYNSHHLNEKQSSNSTLSESNYNLVFIPGAFSKKELEEKESRYEFMRLLTTEDLKISREFSKDVLAALTTSLQVPIVSQADQARYLERVCLKIDEGIYSRNLALTRLVHSPLCYGETLVQNHIDECKKLSKQDCTIQGIACSSRVKQVAEAYFLGIKQYLLRNDL